MTISAAEPRELLPGYFATQRLGAGGYGEVWKVDAPGGLVKAVKLIYGFAGDERAERELKALHRVKQVRHPFVLSLERIEVVEGRLMIVTELADLSLMDRFEQCRESKLPGIPRSELLTYLQDAADALDYMQESHSLQHLDVKPENLLLVGGRAKVADFGLVKELTDRTRSMVGAMTPTYAAPELFDGKASEFCDQYSLAIVYQEMLTGVLPFPGRTPAQLAAQHTQSQPQLAALLTAERAIIAKALAKRPDDRFASCRELVRALLAIETAPDAAAPHPDAHAQPTKQDTGTLCLDDTRQAHSPQAPQATELISARLSSRSLDVGPKPTMERPRLHVSTKIVDVPPPEVGTEIRARAKTLLLGVGGTGIEVLGQLNRFLHERPMAPTARDDVRMLAFDTDRQATRQAAATGIQPEDVVLLRLRHAHEYRADSDALLKWIGRRWLYNVPKSAETGGFRPLGRLAAVDHAGVVASKLRRRLGRLLNDSPDDGDGEENKSAEASPSQPVRVIVVGACSGGSGGGMLLEMAYAVQNIAGQLGTSNIDIDLLVTHATNRCKTTKQLAQANVYSFLSELQHYVRYGSHSVETSAPQTALYESHQWPIRDVYFCHLGDDLSEGQYRAQTQQVAEYLFSDLATPLGDLLRACRRERADDDAPLHDVRLRSFRVSTFEGLGREVGEGIQQHVFAQVINKWFAPAKESLAESPLAESHPEPDAAAQTPTADALLRCVEPLGAVVAARRIRQSIAGYIQRNFEPGGNSIKRPKGPEQWFQSLCDELRELRNKVPSELPSVSGLARSLLAPERELQARLEEAAGQIAEQVLERHLESEGQDRRTSASLQQSLAQDVYNFASELLQQQMPSAKLTADGEMRPDVRAIISSQTASEDNKAAVGCRRRTLVLRPAESGIDEELAKALARPCGFVDGASASVLICQEMEDISLAHLAHSMMAGDSEIRAVAARINTRADIKWTEPPLIECDAEVDEAALAAAK